MTFFCRVIVVLILFFAPLGSPAKQENSTSKKPIVIVTFGDSLMSGYRLPRGNNFASRLENYLSYTGYENVKVINESVAGNQSVDGLSRINDIIRHKPDIVLLGLGINDALNKVDVNVTYHNLKKIVETLHRHKIRVYLIGMKVPDSFGKEYSKKFSGMYKYLANKFSLNFYPFFLEELTGRKNLLLDDHLHPNRRGVEAIVAGVAPSVKELIKQERR